MEMLARANKPTYPHAYHGQNVKFVRDKLSIIALHYKQITIIMTIVKVMPQFGASL